MSNMDHLWDKSREELVRIAERQHMVELVGVQAPTPIAMVRGEIIEWINHAYHVEQVLTLGKQDDEFVGEKTTDAFSGGLGESYQVATRRVAESGETWWGAERAHTGEWLSVVKSRHEDGKPEPVIRVECPSVIKWMRGLKAGGVPYKEARAMLDTAYGYG